MLNLKRGARGKDGWTIESSKLKKKVVKTEKMFLSDSRDETSGDRLKTRVSKKFLGFGSKEREQMKNWSWVEEKRQVI